MKISVCQAGPLRVNCYLIEEEESKKGWIVDPGDEPKKIQEMAEQRGVKPEAVVITHTHFDHIGAAARLASLWNCPVLLTEPEAEEAREKGPFGGYTELIYEKFLPCLEQRGRYVCEGEILTLGAMEWQAILVPGHSRASLCLYNQRENVLISGDTLFRESIGKTDVYPGSPEELGCNLREKLLTLPPDTVVLPGHGPATTIGWEKEHNPYL